MTPLNAGTYDPPTHPFFLYELFGFLVKDAATPKGVPMRWLMCVEDGQWRVANIFFVKDDNMDILMNMREYVDDEKKKSGDPKQY